MSKSSASSTPVVSQYHHFVPQFLLKQYAHPYGSRTSKKDRRRQGRTPVDKSTKRLYPRDLVLNRVDFRLDDPVVTETLVKSVLGEQDMYRDSNMSESRQQEIEGEFSKIESRAATVFRKITKAFEQRETGLSLTRQDRNLLRKFLFLLKYRGPTFRERFNHESIDDYSADDRHLLIKYMREKKFKRPIDVWLHNLRVLIDLKMDIDRKWMDDLPNRMYPEDAKWVILHCEFSYLAICTPSRPDDDEFILTDNCYHVYEGRSNEVFHPSSGNMESLSWIAFHEFAPISPKVMIVLRSFLLPSAVDDANPAIKDTKQHMWSALVGNVFGRDTTSILSNLPIEKAENSYSQIVDGALRLLPGEAGSASAKHTFLFKFFSIDTEHVNKINGIMFQNASTCTSLVFGTQKSFKETLEWYLAADPQELGKRVTTSPTDPKRSCLEKLAKVLKHLGSTCQPRWEVINRPTSSEKETTKAAVQALTGTVREMPESILRGKETKTMRIYRGIGGSTMSLVDDMKQASRMINLRIKLDVWSAGHDEHLRQDVRKNLWEMYLQLPRRRVWFYLKLWRAFELAASMDSPNPTMMYTEQGAKDPLDVIAKASNIIAPHRMNHLMQTAVMNDLRIKRPPGFRPWSKFSMDDDGRRYALELRGFAFALPGPISDCGITQIKDIADSARPHIIREANRRYEDPRERTILREDEEIELITRGMVREMFGAVMRHQFEGDDFSEFSKAFFGLVYPVPTV